MDPRLAAPSRRFGFSLLARSIEQDGLRNRFYSPLSITLALSMLYNGATGLTQYEMARLLGIEGLSLDEVNAANAKLLAGVQRADPKIQIHSAQSLWLHQGFSLQPEFPRIAQRAQQYYQGAVRTLDFTSPSAALTINRWASDETNGKIDQLIERIEKEKLFLLNAIYFKGAWAQPFDRQNTQDARFTLLDGQTVMVPMMRRQGAYPYLRGDGFQAVGVPYGDGQSTLYVFVPESPAGLGSFLSTLDEARWEQWRRLFVPSRIALQLPRFSMQDALDLKAPLSALGMGSAFDPDRATLEGLVQDPRALPRSLYVTQARHAAFLEVNEEGTEAAGATAIGAALTSLPPVVAADRPFFFAIVDEPSDAGLFMGTLVAPR